MKKFTFLLTCFFTAISSFAQSPVITTLYEHSVIKDGVRPAWMGDKKERNMAYYDGKIYVPSVQNGNQIFIIDPETGLKIDEETIDLPDVSGGAVGVSGIWITPSGKIIVCNITTNSSTDPFKVYALTPKTGESGYDFSTILSWSDDVGHRLGDHIAVYGDFTSGGSGYIISANVNTMNVLCWDILNGVVSVNPNIITLEGLYPPHDQVKIHYGPVIYPVDQTRFILNSARMHPTLYSKEGAMLAIFDGDAQPQMAGISGLTHFNFKERSFIVCGTTNYITGVPPNAIEVFEITGGEFNFNQAVSVSGILPENGYGDSNNSTYNVPIINKVLENEVIFWVLVPNNSFAGYKLTIDATSVKNNQINNGFTVYPVPASDFINFSLELKSVALYNMTGQLVLKESNIEKLNVKGLQGSFILKAFDNSGKSFNRLVVIK